MYIENDTIHFKSDEPYYTKEKSGIKKNTVRFISDEEHDIILNVVNDLKYISICKLNERFTRGITDISILKERTPDGYYFIIYIFSWK